MNDRFFKVKARLSSTTFSIHQHDGVTSIGGLTAAETTGGLGDRPMNLVLPFCTGEMFRTDGSFIPKIVQSNDVMYMTHPDYATRVITRTANDVWTIAVVAQDDGPYLTNTTGINIISPFKNSIASTNYWNNSPTIYIHHQVITPVKHSVRITVITKASPPVVTAAGHGFTTGDSVRIDDILKADMNQLNGRTYTIIVLTVDTFSLTGIDSTNFTTHTGPSGIAYIAHTYLIGMDADVFTRDDTKHTTSINFVTQANPAVVDIRALELGTEIADGDDVTINGVSDMWEVNERTFTVANQAYFSREISAAAAVNPAQIDTTSPHNLVTGDIVFLVDLIGTGGGTNWSTLNNTYFTITVPSASRFTLNGIDASAFNVYTANSGDANTTQFELTDPCTGVDIDSTNYVAVGSGGTVVRGQTDRSLRIRFEGNTAQTRWLWGRITKFVSASSIHWTIDSDETTPEMNWLRDDRNDFHDNGIYPTGPGGSREITETPSGSTTLNPKDSGDDWQLGAYSDTTSYPSVVTIHQGRVVVGASDDSPRRLDFTQTGGFDTTSLNFAPTTLDGQVTDNIGISLEVGGGDGSPVQWIQSLDGGLGVGSTNNEGVVEAGGAGSGASITPSNASFRVQSSAGSSSIQPIVVGKSLLHIQRVGRRIYELTYGIESDGYSALDITELAEHLTRSGVIDFAWQQNPINTLWCVLDNGGLIALTYERSADVVGWHHHTLGGDSVLVESVAVIPDPSLERDELWLSVSRGIKNKGQYPWTQPVQTNRYVEFMDRWYEDDLGIKNAYHVDCGRSYTETIKSLDSVTNVGIEAILDISSAGVVEVTNKEFFEGAFVYIEDVCGMEGINDRVYKLGPEVISGTFFYNLLDVDGNDLDVSTFGTYLAGGSMSVVGDSGIAQYTISGITQANPAVVTTTVSHGYAADDIVRITDVVGMVELNNRDFTVGTVTATTFELSGEDSTSHTAYGSVGTTTRYPTPHILCEDKTHGLSNGDVVIFDSVPDMTGINGRYFKVSHSLTNTFRIKYLDGTPVQNFTGDQLLFGALTGGVGAIVDGTWQEAKNVFTGLDHLEGQTVEILHDGRRHADEIVCKGRVELGTKSIKDITAITAATPPVVTSAAHGFSNGDRVSFKDVQGMTELNGGCFLVDSKTVDTFELHDIEGDNLNASGFGAYICAGTATISNLDLFGASVQIGLGSSWFMQTLKIEAGSATGTAQGKTKRIDQVDIRLRDTLGLKYGPDATDLQIEVFDNATNPGGEPILFTGDRELRWNGGYETEGQMYFKGEGPYPAQIQAIMPQVNTQDG